MMRGRLSGSISAPDVGALKPTCMSLSCCLDDRRRQTCGGLYVCHSRNQVIQYKGGGVSGARKASLWHGSRLLFLVPDRHARPVLSGRKKPVSPLPSLSTSRPYGRSQEASYPDPSEKATS